MVNMVRSIFLVIKLPEGEEQFTVELYDPVGGAEISTPSTVTVTVINNDVAVYFRRKLSSYGLT